MGFFADRCTFKISSLFCDCHVNCHILGACKRNVSVNGSSVRVLKINRGNVSVCVVILYPGYGKRKKVCFNFPLTVQYF